MGQHIFPNKKFWRKVYMKEFSFNSFKMNKGGFIKIKTRDGEIISVESPLKECKTENLVEVLKVAVKIDFEQFLEMFKLLNLNTAHYKMCKRILK